MQKAINLNFWREIVVCIDVSSNEHSKEGGKVKMEISKHPKNTSERRTVVIVIHSSLVNGEIHKKLEANPFCRIRGKFGQIMAYVYTVQ